MGEKNEVELIDVVLDPEAPSLASRGYTLAPETRKRLVRVLAEQVADSVLREQEQKKQ